MRRKRKIGKTWQNTLRVLNGKKRWVKVRKIDGKEQIRILKWTKGGK
jgi:hypothetical protein